MYLIRNMKPAMAMLSLYEDGTFRNRARFDLKQCPYIAVIRYGGAIIFSNIDYLEKQVLDAHRPDAQAPPRTDRRKTGSTRSTPRAVDALSVLIDRLQGQGLRFSISGCNDIVLDVLNRTGLTAKIGENNIYRNVERAMHGIWEKAHDRVDEPGLPASCAADQTVRGLRSGPRRLCGQATRSTSTAISIRRTIRQRSDLEGSRNGLAL